MNATMPSSNEIAVAQLAPAQSKSPMARPQIKSFAAETAAITGESKSQINRHIARADALGDDLDRLVGTSLDKGVELDALIKLPEPERKELIERAVAGEKVSAKKCLSEFKDDDEYVVTIKSKSLAILRLKLQNALAAIDSIEAKLKGGAA